MLVSQPRGQPKADQPVDDVFELFVAPPMIIEEVPEELPPPPEPVVEEEDVPPPPPPPSDAEVPSGLPSIQEDGDDSKHEAMDDSQSQLSRSAVSSGAPKKKRVSKAGPPPSMAPPSMPPPSLPPPTPTGSALAPSQSVPKGPRTLPPAAPKGFAPPPPAPTPAPVPSTVSRPPPGPRSAPPPAPTAPVPVPAYRPPSIQTVDAQSREAPSASLLSSPNAQQNDFGSIPDVMPPPTPSDSSNVPLLASDDVSSSFSPLASPASPSVLPPVLNLGVSKAPVVPKRGIPGAKVPVAVPAPAPTSSGKTVSVPVPMPSVKSAAAPAPQQEFVAPPKPKSSVLKRFLSDHDDEDDVSVPAASAAAVRPVSTPGPRPVLETPLSLLSKADPASGWLNTLTPTDVAIPAPVAAVAAVRTPAVAPAHSQSGSSATSSKLKSFLRQQDEEDDDY
jgi:hypothetical protein